MFKKTRQNKKEKQDSILEGLDPITCIELFKKEAVAIGKMANNYIEDTKDLVINFSKPERHFHELESRILSFDALLEEALHSNLFLENQNEYIEVLKRFCSVTMGQLETARELRGLINKNKLHDSSLYLISLARMQDRIKEVENLSENYLKNWILELPASQIHA